jgi:hypothetical protein
MNVIFLYVSQQYCCHCMKGKAAMHTSRYPFGLKMIVVLVFVALHGCATRGVQHHTASYKECVFSQAVDKIPSPDSAEDIARFASGQCQSNLTIINEKLREDNAWIEQYGSNADGYTENLRDRTMADVAEEIRKIRAK